MIWGENRKLRNSSLQGPKAPSRAWLLFGGFTVVLNFSNSTELCKLLFLAQNDITLGVWLVGVAFVPEIYIDLHASS